MLSKHANNEYSATVSGGIFGGVMGTLVGTAGVILAQRRYPTFRGLTLPFRTFLACSGGTFSGILQDLQLDPVLF
jgi:hypothetical protein